MSLIPALGRQMQAISKFEASLVYRVTAMATQENLVSKTKTPKPKKTKGLGFYCCEQTT